MDKWIPVSGQVVEILSANSSRTALLVKNSKDATASALISLDGTERKTTYCSQEYLDALEEIPPSQFECYLTIAPSACELRPSNWTIVVDNPRHLFIEVFEPSWKRGLRRIKETLFG